MNQQREFTYLIIDEDGDAYGTDDGATAQHAHEFGGCIAIETKTGSNLATGMYLDEYPLYEEPPYDPNQPEDL